MILKVINWLFQLITLIVVIDVVLSYFISPFHPVRRYLDRVVEPMLTPIRRLLPQTGLVDFSPLVLIILLQIINVLLQNIVGRFF